ncbi:GGDEF domain-containing protein [Bacillus infantis]|uniref:GGDEF domain-containing protein n=1 Tax=Bacillus infantis TaxID=324767 RepID=A0A5D4SIK5_9BACI|nr:GGDEF domain-containing protein [Bacillus infantis]TYS61918.1 GGDEF domain-containing protein [Bacillus infantis]
MKHTGKIIGSLSLLLFHSVYILYYYLRDREVEPLDLYTYPLLIWFGYWAGKQYDKVKFYSEKDELTGTYNRRYILSNFKKLSNLTEKMNNKLFVVIVDCDNFKVINDTFGHFTGDMILTKISKALAETARQSDIVARWGGDEFLLIGQSNDETEMQTVLQKLEEKIKDLSKEVKMPITLSIGSALYPDDSKNLFELIKIADHHMYSSKNSKKAL